METTKEQTSNGIYEIPYYRRDHKFVSFNHEDSHIKMAVAQYLLNFGYKYLKKYVDYHINQLNLDYSILVDLTNKEILTNSENSKDVSIETFFNICIPQPIKIGNYPVQFFTRNKEKLITIGCQTITKSKVEEIYNKLFNKDK